MLRATLAALIETPLQNPRGSALRKSGRDIVSHVPFFSRTAAFLLNAMAALPRKSDPDGAASLPWQTIALPRGGASRECGKMTLRRFSPGSAEEVNRAAE